MERRKFIKLTSLGGLSIGLINSSSFLLTSCNKKNSNQQMSGGYTDIIEGDFQNSFVELPVVGSSNSLTALETTWSTGSSSINVLGYATGTILGPTIVLNSGDTLSVNLQNNLNEETNIHWHGLSVPANMDGHPMDLVNSGSSTNYQFQINQRASFCWYHPHTHNKTGKQAFKGLAGGIIIRDAEESSLNLPSGTDELAIVLQDKRISVDNSIYYSPQHSDVMTGYLGSTLLVNGKSSPLKSVSTKWYRLRILNGSNARVYNLGLSNNTNFYIIGSDGGLLTTPESVTSILLGPGERIDVLVDFSNYAIGTELYLISKTFSNAGIQGVQEFKMLKFIVNQQVSSPFSLPSGLSVIVPISEASASITRTFDISNANMGGMGMGGGMLAHSINGLTYDPNVINEEVNMGATEIWEFENTSGMEPHPMHIHGVQFQVLDRIGGRNQLIASERGWKDTVLVLPGEKVRVIMTFGPYQGVYMIHCHNLEHEDNGMMLQFKIT